MKPLVLFVRVLRVPACADLRPALFAYWDYMISLAIGCSWGCGAAQCFLNRNHGYLVQYIVCI